MKTLITVLMAVALTPVYAGRLAAQKPTPADRGATISMTRAQTIALARVPRNEGVKSAKLKKKDGMLVYEFDIETPGAGHQEVRVDAMTGAIVSNKHEDDLVGKSAKKVGGAAEDAGKAVAKTADKVFGKDDMAGVHPAISEMRARAIAQQRVPNAAIKDVDLETEHGILVWEIDLDTPGPGREELMIDATTGAVLRQHHEDDIVGGTIDKMKKH